MSQTLKIWKISLLLLVGLLAFLYVLASTAVDVYLAVTHQSARLINTKEIFLKLVPGVLFCYSLSWLGTFVFFKKIQERTAQIFYLMLLFWALAMHYSLDLGDSFFSLLPSWAGWIVLPAWPLAVGLLLHFYLIFPVENQTFQKHHRLCLILIYLPLVLILPFAYARLNDFDWADKILNYGWGIWLTANFNLAMFVLSHAIKHAPNAYIKKQAQVMANGTAVSLSIPLTVYFLPWLFFGKSFPLAEFSLLLLILWPVTLAYVIVKHRFMDIDVIVKRGVSYAIVSGIVIAAYFLVVLGVGQLVLFLTGARRQIVTIIATLLIAALFNPLKNRVQNFLDRRFYPQRFLIREAIRKFSHQLVNVVDFETLLNLLKSFFAETLQIRPVALFMRDERAQSLIVRAVAGIEPAEIPEFTAEDKIIKKLQNSQQLADLSALQEQEGFIPEEEKTRWKQLQAELVLPLLSKKNLVGILALGAKQEDETYYKEDLDLLATLGDQINIALENTLLTEKLREQDRLKKELEVARRIQISSLPQTDPQIPGLEITGVSIPALEVGGDYYDYLHFADGRFGVVVGDVSGKGASAALYMSQLKGMLQAGAKHHRSLKDLLVEINALIFPSLTAQSFITLMCGVFNMASRRLSLVRAGHLPLLHYSAGDRACRHHLPKGLGLGLENGRLFKTELEEIELTFGPGDIFLFYTDGLTEARDAQGNELETAWLEKIICQNGVTSAAALRENIVSQLQRLAHDDSPQDDMTLVVVRANG
jgi:serine phosphatase RsbU (regulator of sigma subunit)